MQVMTLQIVVSCVGIALSLSVSVFRYIMLERAKPKLVICQVIFNACLVKASPNVVNDINILYRGAEVVELWCFSVCIFNNGREDITDAIIRLSFERGIKILSWSVDEHPKESDLQTWVLKDSKIESRTIKLDHLNSKRFHKKIFRINFICDGQPKQFVAYGSGVGWSVHNTPIKHNTGPSTLFPNWLFYGSGALLLFLSIRILSVLPSLQYYASAIKSFDFLVFCIFLTLLIKTFYNLRIFYGENVSAWVNFVKVRKSGN